MYYLVFLDNLVVQMKLNLPNTRVVIVLRVPGISLVILIKCVDYVFPFVTKIKTYKSELYLCRLTEKHHELRLYEGFVDAGDRRCEASQEGDHVVRHSNTLEQWRHDHCPNTGDTACDS